RGKLWISALANGAKGREPTAASLESPCPKPTRCMAPAARCWNCGRPTSITNVLNRLLSEPLAQLRQVKAGRFNRLAVRIENAFRQLRLMAKRHAAHLPGSLAADRPIGRARRLLDHIAPGLAVPGHRPADGPTMTRSHLP